jgi:hypothetical protein
MGILEVVILWGRVQAVHKGKKFDRQMSLTSIVIATASAAG